MTVGAVTVRLQPETARALATVLDRALAMNELDAPRFHRPLLAD